MVHPELEGTVTPLLDRISCPADLASLDDDDLVRLAGELRSELISTVSRTGGHLGSGLGVVELTIAIHSVFSTPHDKLIWDVSHQCYPHKILTGRRERMGSLRKRGGLSGFTRRAESRFDPFGAAHSSTSISAGLGFATARDLGGEGGEVICVIGDGAMSAGMAFEAINNAGASGRRMFVILNDNAMSISEPVGAFSRWLQQLREAGNKVAAEIPQSSDCDAARFFNTLGFAYRGPVDGHDLPALLKMLRTAKSEATGPVLLHVRTRKGAGYSYAEESADKFHGVSRFDIATGIQVKPVAKALSYTEVFSCALISEARRDHRIVAITAAMASGTGLDEFGRVFPERTFDVGIAEQHAVTFAAGLAAGGMRPFCAIYSTFLQRGYDQLVHDVALQGLPVRFAIDRAGLVGADGAIHAGSFDIAYLGNLPGFVVMAASDEAELCRMVATAVAYDSGPIAFRYPRGEGVGIALPKSPRPLKIGKGRVIEQGRTVALLSFGTRLGECREAARLLAARGISTTIADARFARPLDASLVEALAANHELLVTVEEGAEGGFGAIVLQHLAERGMLDGRCAIRTMTLPGQFIHQGAPHEMYAEAGLDAGGIFATVCSALGIDRFSGLRGIDSAERVAAPA